VSRNFYIIELSTCSPLIVATMSTSFSSLPIVSLSALSSSTPSVEALNELSSHLDEVFSTTGFAYLTDLPLTYSHYDVFSICDDFFGQNGLSENQKMKLAKKTFVKNNKNTYRGLVSRDVLSDSDQILPRDEMKLTRMQILSGPSWS
jgi:isopenicillin N synthase-like dioxygenase